MVDHFSYIIVAPLPSLSTGVVSMVNWRFHFFSLDNPRPKYPSSASVIRRPRLVRLAAATVLPAYQLVGGSPHDFFEFVAAVSTPPILSVGSSKRVNDRTFNCSVSHLFPRRKRNARFTSTCRLVHGQIASNEVTAVHSLCCVSML